MIYIDYMFLDILSRHDIDYIDVYINILFIDIYFDSMFILIYCL